MAEGESVDCQGLEIGSGKSIVEVAFLRHGGSSIAGLGEDGTGSHSSSVLSINNWLEKVISLENGLNNLSVSSDTCQKVPCEDRCVTQCSRVLHLLPSGESDEHFGLRALPQDLSGIQSMYSAKTTGQNRFEPSLIPLNSVGDANLSCFNFGDPVLNKEGVFTFTATQVCKSSLEQHPSCIQGDEEPEKAQKDPHHESFQVNSLSDVEITPFVGHMGFQFTANRIKSPVRRKRIKAFRKSKKIVTIASMPI